MRSLFFFLVLFCLRAFPSEVIQIAAGTSHACAISSDHELKCWGHGAYGQLGLEEEADRESSELPSVDLGTGRTALSVACGDQHTCAILDDHSVKCWGDNSHRQVGPETSRREYPGARRGTMGDALRPFDLGLNRRALSIAAQGMATCAVLDDRSVLCWGSLYDDIPNPEVYRVNLYGHGALAVTVGTTQACALLDDGTVICWGQDDFGLARVTHRSSVVIPSLIDLGRNRKVVSLSAGFAHTCALLDDASVKCWGTNDYAQLGLGDRDSRGIRGQGMGDELPSVNVFREVGVESIYCGSGYHCCATSRVTHLTKCWGVNSSGELGLELPEEVLGGRSSEMGDALPFVNLGHLLSVRTMAVGSGFSCAVLNNGRVKCWGRNLGWRNFEVGSRQGSMGEDLLYAELW